MCKSSAVAKITEEDGSVPGAKAEFSLKLVVKTMVRKAVALWAVEAHRGSTRRKLQPHGEVCAGAGSCQVLGPCEESSTQWSKFSGRSCDPMGNPHWDRLFLKECILWDRPTLEQFGKNCSLWEGLTGKFLEGCLPWKGSHGGAGEREERSSEIMVMNGPITSIPHPLVLLRGRRQRIHKWCWAQEEHGVGDRCIKICFNFSLLYSDWLTID